MAAHQYITDPRDLKPGDRLIGSDGNDWSWAFVVFRRVPGATGYVVGTDQSIWSSWTAGRKPRSDGPWKRMILSEDRKGYIRVMLRVGPLEKKTYWIAPLILETFIGSCPCGMECCHNNGIRTDNRLLNLRWDTRLSNAHDRIKHGRHAVGERSVLAKLTEDQVRSIRRLCESGISQSRVASMFGVSRGAVSDIRLGKRWAHVEGARTDLAGQGLPRGLSHRNAKISDEDVEEIRRLSFSGLSQRHIAQRFGISQRHVSDIVKHRRR